MKKVLKISALLLVFFAAFSCENDDQTIINPSGGPELLTPEDGSEYVLLPENASNDLVTLVWNHADYGVQTQVNYEIELALANTDFAEVVSAGTTSNRFLVWKVEELNGAMTALGATPYTPTDVDMRIKSSLGTNEDVVAYSNTITLTITPYSTDLPKIAVPGNHQGWSPGTAPELAAYEYGNTDYDGYVWLDGEFKFIAANDSGVYDWGNTDWGDDGTFTNTLVEQGESNCNATAGYYRLRANTTSLTYDATQVSWGVIGSATAAVTGGSGWDSDADMTYDAATGVWSIVITLGDGEIKFRYNNNWNNGADQWNLGGYKASEDGTLNYAGDMMTYGGENIAVTAGTYLIELDLSNPRAYTYSLTPQ